MSGRSVSPGRPVFFSPRDQPGASGQIRRGGAVKAGCRLAGIGIRGRSLRPPARSTMHVSGLRYIVSPSVMHFEYPDIQTGEAPTRRSTEWLVPSPRTAELL